MGDKLSNIRFHTDPIEVGGHALESSEDSSVASHGPGMSFPHDDRDKGRRKR